jgi:hypothetical protein
MTRRKIHDVGKVDVVIATRLTPAQAERYRAAAKAAGMRPSELARLLLVDYADSPEALDLPEGTKADGTISKR